MMKEAISDWLKGSKSKKVVMVSGFPYIGSFRIVARSSKTNRCGLPIYLTEVGRCPTSFDEIEENAEFQHRLDEAQKADESEKKYKDMGEIPQEGEGDERADKKFKKPQWNSAKWRKYVDELYKCSSTGVTRISLAPSRLQGASAGQYSDLVSAIQEAKELQKKRQTRVRCGEPNDDVVHVTAATGRYNFNGPELYTINCSASKAEEYNPGVEVDTSLLAQRGEICITQNTNTKPVPIEFYKVKDPDLAKSLHDQVKQIFESFNEEKLREMALNRTRRKHGLWGHSGRLLLNPCRRKGP